MVKRSLLGSLVLTILFWVGVANWAVLAYLRAKLERRRLEQVLDNLDFGIKVDNFADSFGKTRLELGEHKGIKEYPCATCNKLVTDVPGPSVVVMFDSTTSLEWFCDESCLQQYLTAKILLGE